ncbi:MAG: hypothetical protein AB1755_01660 [Candidatus Omnitrophota bacterium]
MKRNLYKLILIIIIFIPANALAVDVWNLPVDIDLLQTVKYENVTGNRSLSFKEPGWHSLTELGLSAAKQFQDGWISSFQMQLRKTDDDEIDPNHNSVRLLSWLIETRNDTFDIQIGDIYSNFTDLTLSRSLEGVSVDSTFDRVTLNTVLSRVGRRDTTIPNPTYMRYVLGQRANYQVIRDGAWINDLKLGANFVYNIDDTGTIKEMEQNATGLRNYVWSLDQELQVFDNLKLTSEFARSFARDNNTVTIDGHRLGNAIKAGADYDKDPVGFSFRFHRIDPNFMTDSGSATIDQEMYQYTLRLFNNSRFSTTFNYMTYHDNLDKIPGQEATNTRNPSIAFRIIPIKDRRSFTINPRYDFRWQRSTLRTTDNRTHTADITVSDYVGDFSWNWGYNYRKFGDYAGTNNNIVNTGTAGISYRFSFPDFSYTPGLNYTYIREFYSSPFDRIDRTNNVAFNFDFTVGSKFTGRFNYSFQASQRQAVDANTLNQRGGFDFNYRLWDTLTLKTYLNVNKNWRKGGGFSVREIDSGMTLNARF